MAGIGFELKKLFAKKGILANLKAYGYASIVCTGPMLLSIVLLLGIRYIGVRTGVSKGDLEVLNSMITYSLLVSLVVSSLFSMISSRYVADMIFMKKKHRVLSSMYGNIVLSLLLGGISYGIFLYFSGISLFYQLLCFFLFCEATIVWIQIGYLTAIKNYREILLLFFFSVLAALVAGFFLTKTALPQIGALMIAILLGYGILFTGYFVVLHRYFRVQKKTAYFFTAWIDKYPQLLGIGLFTTIGLFGHLIIMWTSPINVQVVGLFYGAPTYDVPALVAFLSVLITTVNFVTFLEVNFYGHYKQYFGLFNNKGTFLELKKAEGQMFKVLEQELYYLALKQVITTVLFVVLVGPLLVSLGIGFSHAMMGTFVILCVGYGFYAIGNSIMLMQLYFSDNDGALLSSFIFMLSTCAFTLLLRGQSPKFYGFGFLAGSMIFYFVSWLRLSLFCKHLDYHVICTQPFLSDGRQGFFTRWVHKSMVKQKISD